MIVGLGSADHEEHGREGGGRICDRVKIEDPRVAFLILMLPHYLDYEGNLA